MTLSVDDLLIDIAKNPTESKQTMLKLEEQELEWHRTELSKLQDHNIVSFAVSRTSGVRDSNGWIVDWALVTRDEIEDVSEFNTVCKTTNQHLFPQTVLVPDLSNSVLQ